MKKKFLMLNWVVGVFLSEFCRIRPLSHFTNCCSMPIEQWQRYSSWFVLQLCPLWGLKPALPNSSTLGLRYSPFLWWQLTWNTPEYSRTALGKRRMCSVIWVWGSWRWNIWEHSIHSSSDQCMWKQGGRGAGVPRRDVPRRYHLCEIQHHFALWRKPLSLAVCSRRIFY